MTRWRGKPGYVAARMVEAVRNGEIQRRGEWVNLADTVASFPPSLRKWTIAQITPVLGEEGMEYLISFASTPTGRYTIKGVEV